MRIVCVCAVVCVRACVSVSAYAQFPQAGGLVGAAAARLARRRVPVVAGAGAAGHVDVCGRRASVSGRGARTVRARRLHTCFAARGRGGRATYTCPSESRRRRQASAGLDAWRSWRGAGTSRLRHTPHVMHARTHARTYISIHTHTHARARTHTHTYTHTTRCL